MSLLANNFSLIDYILAVITFLKLNLLLSDPNYKLWHQLRFQNVKAENVVFGQFQTLTEIITVFLSFIKNLKITVIIPDIDYILWHQIPCRYQ